MTKKRELTDKQKAFLNALFGEAKGKVREAMRIAGYSATCHPSEIVAPLKEEIIERGLLDLAGDIALATGTFRNAMEDPTAAGTRDAVNAAREVLDRVGLVKVERVDHTISSPSGIVILPPKKKSNVPTEEGDK